MPKFHDANAVKKPSNSKADSPSRHNAGTAKFKYNDPMYSGDLDGNRRDEAKDSAVMNPKNNSIPTEAFIKQWIQINPQGTPVYDDTAEGIDAQMAYDRKKAERGH